MRFFRVFTETNLFFKLSTEFYRDLPGFTGFYRVFTETNLFFKLSTEFDRNGVSLCFLLNVSELLSFLIEFFLGPIALRTGLP